MSAAAKIDVRCAPSGQSWECQVVVSDERGTADYVVTVSSAELARYSDGATDPTALVRASFRFLLERERRESILNRFALSDIERYFPEYGRQSGR